MARYNPQTKRLQKSKSLAKTRIRRSQKAINKIANSTRFTDNLSEVLDTAGAFAKAGMSIEAATADTAEEGREAVGLERTDTDLSMWEKLGRRFKGPEDTTESVYGDEYDGKQDVHTYKTSELRNIGKETIAGTAVGTLAERGAENWSDIAGTSSTQTFTPRVNREGQLETYGVEVNDKLEINQDSPRSFRQRTLDNVTSKPTNELMTDEEWQASNDEYDKTFGDAWQQRNIDKSSFATSSDAPAFRSTTGLDKDNLDISRAFADAGEINLDEVPDIDVMSTEYQAPNLIGKYTDVNESQYGEITPPEPNKPTFGQKAKGFASNLFESVGEGLDKIFKRNAQDTIEKEVPITNIDKKAIQDVNLDAKHSNQALKAGDNNKPAPTILKDTSPTENTPTSVDNKETAASLDDVWKSQYSSYDAALKGRSLFEKTGISDGFTPLDNYALHKKEQMLLVA